MKALIQRVRHAAVHVAGERIGQIQQGALVFLGVEKGDNEQVADKLLQKILKYRIFSDAEGKMNCSVIDVNGGLLVVSQFTLVADTQKGLRPSFSSAAPPVVGQQIYDYFVAQAAQRHADVQAGIFGADMQVELVNDGPVTFMLEA